MVDEITWVGAAQRDAAAQIHILDQRLHDREVEGKIALGAAALEDALEVVDRRALGRHLVTDAAQKRFVDQFGRLDVGGEHDEQHEGHRQLLPGLHCQVIDARFERRDPPVEQRHRGALLTAEVIDDQHATVRRQLDRRLVELGRRTERQIQVLELQFTADHDRRPPTAHPSPVSGAITFVEAVTAVLNRQRLVHRGVVHLDDVSVRNDGTRDGHLPVEEVPNRSRNHGLAVSRAARRRRGSGCR